MSIHPPGDTELYRGKLRLTTRQRVTTAVYASAGIVGGVLMIAAGITVLREDRLTQSIPALFFGALGLLPLWIGIGILRKSVLRH